MAKTILNVRDSAYAYMSGVKQDVKRQEFDAKVNLTQSQLESLYSGNDLVRNVCDMYAEDMTAQGVDWHCSPDAAELIETEFRDKLIWTRLSDAIKWARLYGGSIAMINTGDARYDAPINTSSDFLGLMVFDRYELVPNTQKLLTGVHAGDPASYEVTPRVFAEKFTLDASRAIRFVGNSLPNSQLINNQLWGASVVNAMYRALCCFEQGSDDALELLHRAYLRFLGVKDFWQTLMSGDDEGAQALAKGINMINSLQNVNGLTVADKEDTFSALSYSFGGVPGVLQQFAQRISSATGIPLVRLFGMSPAGFSTGEADLKNYYSSINRAQERSLREAIGRIARVILDSHGMSDEPVSFDFVSHDQPTQFEKIQEGQAAINAITSVFDKGLINADRALQEIKRAGERSGLFSTVTDEEIEALKLPAVPEYQPEGPTLDPNAAI